MPSSRGHAQEPVATVIGDLVRSKQARDRAALHRELLEHLAEVNREVAAEQELDVTVGDEFQAVYSTVGDALLACLLLRLALLPEVDTRYGVGWGSISIFDSRRRPTVQDGPGWWAAREAITYVKAQERRKARARHLRTWFVSDSQPPPGDPSAMPAPTSSLNAFLLCRDQLIGQQNDRGRRLLLGWLVGSTQHELAKREGITQSAVSQHLASSGSYAITEAHALLREATAWIS